MSEALPGTGEPVPPLVLYQRLAAARQRLLSGAANRVPLVSVASQARALALWDGRQVAPGDEAQLALFLDLGVFDPAGGHRPGLERQARADAPVPGSDEAVMLAALQAARFGLWRVLGPHAEGGAALLPLGAEAGAAPLWVMDTGLRDAPRGSVVAARLAHPAGAPFALTCGAVAPVDARVMERLLLDLPSQPREAPVMPSLPPEGDAAAMDRLLGEPAARLRLAALLRTPGLAARAYRHALDLGLMGPVPGRTPEGAAPRSRN